MKNKQTLIEIFKLDKNISLWEFIKFEKQIGLHLSNEDNYKQILRKSDYPEVRKLPSYISSARTIVRLWWFAQYICLFLTTLRQTNSSLVDCAKDAYVTTLEPHHSWGLAFVTKIAIHTCCTRNFCLEQMGVTSFQKTKVLTDNFKIVRDKLESFCL